MVMTDKPKKTSVIEIASEWAARKRERFGTPLLLNPHPRAKNAGRVGQPR